MLIDKRARQRPRAALVPRFHDAKVVDPEASAAQISNLCGPITIRTAEHDTHHPQIADFLGPANPGDVIFWSRFLTPLIARTTSTITLEVDPRLVGLLARSFLPINVRSWTRQSPPWALPWVPLFQVAGGSWDRGS